MQKEFSLLVKPVAGDCNLRCRYCFYLEKGAGPGDAAHRMDDRTLERLIADYLGCSLSRWHFAWQGGEPTLAGLEFFRRATALMARQARPGAVVGNALQTNGTLLDDAWGEFLARHRFLVGISLDGPAELHDAYRVAADGRGSHAEVLRGLDVLRRHRVEFNVLTVVNAVNAAHPLRLYRYLRDELGIAFQQYLECVEWDRSGRPAPFAVSPVAWGRFLCALFDEWYEHDVGRVSIRLFDAVIRRLAGGPPELCAMDRRCEGYLVVEHDGGVYPCDFFVAPEWRLGRVGERPPADFFELPKARGFARRKLKTGPACRSCRHFRLCAGDCVKNRDGGGGSALCAGWRMFYDHTAARFRQLADRVAANSV